MTSEPGGTTIISGQSGHSRNTVPPAHSAVVMDSHNEKLIGLVVAAGAKMLAIDDGRSPILVAPIGKDATTTAVERSLDPRRTVAVDLTGDANKRITLMMPPNGDPQVRDFMANQQYRQQQLGLGRGRLGLQQQQDAFNRWARTRRR